MFTSLANRHIVVRLITCIFFSRIRINTSNLNIKHIYVLKYEYITYFVHIDLRYY